MLEEDRTARWEPADLRSADQPNALAGASDLLTSQAAVVDRTLARTRSNRAAIVARAWPSVRDDLAQLGRRDDRFDGPAYR